MKGYARFVLVQLFFTTCAWASLVYAWGLYLRDWRPLAVYAAVLTLVPVLHGWAWSGGKK